MLCPCLIVHFFFVTDDPINTTFLEEEYLKQVEDKKSALYKGKVTCHIDQKQTQAMTMQLQSSRLIGFTPCIYQVGDTITIARVGEEQVQCKIECLLGKGAMATVFKATTSGKICALKVFKVFKTARVADKIHAINRWVRRGRAVAAPVAIPVRATKSVLRFVTRPLRAVLRFVTRPLRRGARVEE